MGLQNASNITDCGRPMRGKLIVNGENDIVHVYESGTQDKNVICQTRPNTSIPNLCPAEFVLLRDWCYHLSPSAMPTGGAGVRECQDRGSNVLFDLTSSMMAKLGPALWKFKTQAGNIIGDCGGGNVEGTILNTLTGNYSTYPCEPPCAYGPCLAQGSTCVNVGDFDFYCICPDEYFGKRCEMLFQPWLVRLRKRYCNEVEGVAKLCYYFYE